MAPSQIVERFDVMSCDVERDVMWAFKVCLSTTDWGQALFLRQSNDQCLMCHAEGSPLLHASITTTDTTDYHLKPMHLCLLHLPAMLHCPRLCSHNTVQSP